MEPNKRQVLVVIFSILAIYLIYFVSQHDFSLESIVLVGIITLIVLCIIIIDKLNELKKLLNNK